MPPTPPPATTGTITGKILENGTIKAGIVCYIDARNTGKFENDYLHSTSDAGGNIFFANLAPGHYKVRQLKDSLDANGLKQVEPDPSQWPMKAAEVDVVAGAAAQAIFKNLSVNSPSPQPSPGNLGATLPDFAFGIGGGGIVDPAYDPVKHPEIIAACHDLGATRFRGWCIGDLGHAVNSDMWNITRMFQVYGIGYIAVINAQNFAGKNPSPKVMVNHFNTWPSSAETGVADVEVFNEIDYPTGAGPYFTGSARDYLNIMQAIYPILKAKGYRVIAANMVKSLGYLNNLLSLGLAKCCDAIGVHAYMPTAAGASPYYQTLTNVAKDAKLAVANTERGAHNAADWPGELGKSYVNARTVTGGLNVHFCLLRSTESGGAPGGILEPVTYARNANYAAIKASLGL